MKNEGWFLMTYMADRYGSCGWYASKADAEKELKRRLAAGTWSGMPPKIEAAGPCRCPA